MVYTSWGQASCTHTYPFTGSFGCDSNGSLTLQSATTGVFGTIKNATIRNLPLTTTISTTSSTIGGLANIADSCSIWNVNETVTINNAGSTVGGLIGQDSASQIRFITIQSSNINASGNAVGGLIGAAFDSNIYNTTVDVTNMKCNNSESSECYNWGGISGYAQKASFTFTKFSGTVNAYTYVGGFVGQQYYGRADSCVSIATVIGNGYVGGFVGYAPGSPIFTYCGAFGEKVDAWSNAGGFVGYATNEAWFGYCLNGNRITAADKAGGFAGVDSTITAINSYSFAKVDCQYSNCWCFAENVEFLEETDTAAYYVGGCNKNVASNVIPIEMNGTTMTSPSIGSNMTCTLQMGTFSISIPGGIQDLVRGDICI